jgi:hypothetical protein
MGEPHRLTVKTVKPKLKIVFTVNVPKGFNNVYIAGSFNSWKEHLCA